MNINDLARKGAEYRLAELHAETRELIRLFPTLAPLAEVPVTSAEAQVTMAAAPVRKRTMSAKARKAIGAAQRARWAKLRNGK